MCTVVVQLSHISIGPCRQRICHEFLIVREISVIGRTARNRSLDPLNWHRVVDGEGVVSFRLLIVLQITRTYLHTLVSLKVVT